MDLEVHGDVARPGAFSVEDLRRLPGQVADVSTVAPGRKGPGVRLAAVLEAVGARGAWLKLSSTDGFSIAVPRAGLEDAVLALVPVDKGGPVRLFVPEAATCGDAPVDACANVKSLSDIEVTPTRAPDTHRH